MNENPIFLSRLNRLFIPTSPANAALVRLEFIADALEGSFLADLGVDTPSIADLAANIRQCVDVLRLDLM